LDARNLPCNFLPPNQEPAGWNVLRNMLFDLINEDRVAASVVAHGTDSEEEETSWLATASGMVNFEVTAEEIADKEIGLWKLRTVPLPKTDNPLMEWKRCEAKQLWPLLARLARRVLAVPATSASPERLFSTAGNEMTNKRTRLTCDNLETVVYLHEMWPKTCEWETLASTSRRISCFIKLILRVLNSSFPSPRASRGGRSVALYWKHHDTVEVEDVSHEVGMN